MAWGTPDLVRVRARARARVKNRNGVRVRVRVKLRVRVRVRVRVPVRKQTPLRPIAKWPPSSGARLRCSPHAPSTLATNSAAGWEAHGPGARGRREEARPRRRKRRG